jgi:alkylation response protein AidB-like acyl-CoA dehydrogenase
MPIVGGRGAFFADAADLLDVGSSGTGIDPEAGWAIVETASPLTPRQTALARRAVAHELIGVAVAMLETAVAHVIARQQFGVPIGSFQAVQHRLADVLVAIESTRAVLRIAWVDDDPWTCWAGRRAAGEAFEIAVANCGQVLGALGFTWEHPHHRYVRRGLLLSSLNPGGAVAEDSPPASPAELFS